MKQETVRISFDIPADEHHRLKMACVNAKKSIKDCAHEMILMCIKHLEEEALHQKLREAVQESREGKTRIITSEELERMIQDG